jgi:hypothetical protein
MTEAEWLARSRLDLMVDYVAGQGSDRRHRLLACACCDAYRQRAFQEPDCLRAALDLAEQAAEGRVDENQRGQASARLRGALNENDRWDLRGEGWIPFLACGDRPEIERVPREILAAFSFDINAPARTIVGPRLHCIFGNPFRPVALDPRWRTADVTALARGIYEDRAFDRLPLLADALMDAGCGDEQVLAHCRSDGPHVRGCWVVDLVLGKE